MSSLRRAASLLWPSKAPYKVLRACTASQPCERWLAQRKGSKCSTCFSSKRGWRAMRYICRDGHGDGMRSRVIPFPAEDARVRRALRRLRPLAARGRAVGVPFGIGAPGARRLGETARKAPSRLWDAIETGAITTAHVEVLDLLKVRHPRRKRCFEEALGVAPAPARADLDSWRPGSLLEESCTAKNVDALPTPSRDASSTWPAWRFIFSKRLRVYHKEYGIGSEIFRSSAKHYSSWRCSRVGGAKRYR